MPDEQNIQPQTQQTTTVVVKQPIREFVQVDTSSNAYMEKGGNNDALQTKVAKDT